jgi:hypothetical protein
MSYPFYTQVQKQSSQSLKCTVFSADDLREKVTEIATLNNQIRDQAQRREQELEDALQVSEKFHDFCSETMSNLRDYRLKIQ